MANLPTNNVKTQFRSYQDFSGVDFSNSEVKTYRSPNSVNMWKNYNNSLGKGIETRPGMTLLANLKLEIFSIFFYTVNNNEQVLVHAGTKLYKWLNFPNTPQKSDLVELFTGMNIIQSQSFIFNNILFIKDGINYLEYDGVTIKQVEGTIPTTTIGKVPSGVGEVYQDINLLTSKRRNSFVADGESLIYVLDAKDYDEDTRDLDLTPVSAIVNGIELIEGIGFDVDRSNATVTFKTAPQKPLTDGQDNVIITFSKTIDGNKEKITKCNILAEFDKRIFFSGNQDYPNVLFHTELEDPRYISDQNYYNEGMDLTPINALIPGNNCIFALKEQNQANTTVFYHTPTIDSNYGKVYPSIQANISTGCKSTGINFNDDIVFLSNNGLEAIAGNIESERVLNHRSSLVDKKLINENNYENAKLVEYQGYLLILVNGKIYLADFRQQYNNINVEYEWYYWELPFEITFIKEYKEKLFLGNSSGDLFVLQGDKDNGEDIFSKWSTPEDAFGYEAYRKTTNKNGCVANVMPKGATIKVEVITDNEDAELIGEYEDIKEYIVCRIKQKKWKRIQLIFSSNQPFGIYSCTLEAFIGGYLKR